MQPFIKFNKDIEKVSYDKDNLVHTIVFRFILLKIFISDIINHSIQVQHQFSKQSHPNGKGLIQNDF